MSGYTIGEIVVWLALAAVLGFALGWLLRELRCRSQHGAAAPAALAASPAPSTPASAPVVESAGFAKSAEPLAGGRAPTAEYVIKGNRDSMLYHSPDSRSYRQTIAEVWFKTEADAIAAGFHKSGTADVAGKKAAAKAPAKRTATKTAAKKTSASKTAAKQAPAKAPASKTTAKKTAAKKTAAKKTAAKKTPAKKIVAKQAPTIAPGRFPGSAKPRPGGRAPSAAYTIKGNEDSMIYHSPDSPSYDQTIAETWFRSEADAVAAGFRKPRNL